MHELLSHHEVLYAAARSLTDMGIKYVPTVQEAFNLALEKKENMPKTAVMPEGVSVIVKPKQVKKKLF